MSKFKFSILASNPRNVAAFITVYADGEEDAMRKARAVYKAENYNIQSVEEIPSEPLPLPVAVGDGA